MIPSALRPHVICARFRLTDRTRLYGTIRHEVAALLEENAHKALP